MPYPIVPPDKFYVIARFDARVGRWDCLQASTFYPYILSEFERMSDPKNPLELFACMPVGRTTVASPPEGV